MWPFTKQSDEQKSWSLDLPDLAMVELFTGGARQTSSGESVGPESSMRVPAALCAARTIAETLASLPLRVYQRGEGNSREIDLDHPANALLAQPTPWSSGYELRLGLVYDAIKYGQAFAFAVRGGGKVKELHRTLLGAMRYEIDTATMEPRYTLTTDGEVQFGWQDVVHIVPLPPSQMGALPMSLISAAAEPIGMANAMARHGGNLFRNGARPGGVISMLKRIDKDAFERLREGLRKRFSQDGVGETMILEDGAKWEQLTMTSVDAQYLDTWRFQILEISRAFRVPPHKLGEMDRATHANSEELGLQFVAYCMRPWANLFEGAFSRVLLTPAERATHFLEFDFDDLEKGNMAGRLEALGSAVINGVYTSDEARAKENLPAKPGGDELRVPLNSVVPNSPRDVMAPAAPAPHAEPPKPRLVA